MTRICRHLLAPLCFALASCAAQPHADRDCCRIDRHLRAGEAALDAGDLDRAESAFSLQLEFDPDDPAAHRGLCRIALMRGEPKKVAEHCPKAPEESVGQVLRE